MRKLTLLPLAFAAAAACSSEQYCDPFLEASDCVRGQTPTGILHRAQEGVPTAEGSPVSASPNVSPSAGSANGPGPSPGSANGPGPSPGPAVGPGPSAGAAQGIGPSPGSTNPADSLMGGESGASRCAAFCREFYTTCAERWASYSEIPVGQVIAACTSGCECYRRLAPSCIDAFLDAVGPCLGHGSCLDVADCMDTTLETVPEPASCSVLDDLPEGTCQGFAADSSPGDVVYGP